MSQAAADPEQLRRFAEHLQRLIHGIEQMGTETSRALSHLGDTWRDEQYVRFYDRFEQDAKRLEEFIEAASRTIPQLQQDAATIEEFQSRGNQL